METRIKGYASNESIEYKQHARVLEACIDAGIKELPTETATFFGCKDPDESLLLDTLEVKIPVHYVDGIDMTDAYDVIISEIPPNVHKIRFSNSY